MEATMMICKACKEVTEHLYSEFHHCWVCLSCANGVVDTLKPTTEYRNIEITKGKVISFEAFSDKWTVADSKQADDRLKRDKDSG